MSSASSSRCTARSTPRRPSELARKVVKGKGFDMADLKGQLEQLQKMGGVGALLDKLPLAAAQKRAALSAEQGDRDLRRQIAIINSMTRGSAAHPAIIDGSRRRRIAGGSGVQVQDVNRLLKQFMEMQRVMKSMKGGKLRQLMSALKGGGIARRGSRRRSEGPSERSSQPGSLRTLTGRSRLPQERPFA